MYNGIPVAAICIFFYVWCSTIQGGTPKNMPRKRLYMAGVYLVIYLTHVLGAWWEGVWQEVWIRVCGEPRFLGDGGFVALGHAGCSITLQAHLLASQLSFGLWAFSEMS